MIMFISNFYSTCSIYYNVAVILEHVLAWQVRLSNVGRTSLSATYKQYIQPSTSIHNPDMSPLTPIRSFSISTPFRFIN